MVLWRCIARKTNWRWFKTDLKSVSETDWFIKTDWFKTDWFGTIPYTVVIIWLIKTNSVM
jgi:hypothetical protein